MNIEGVPRAPKFSLRPRLLFPCQSQLCGGSTCPGRVCSPARSLTRLSTWQAPRRPSARSWPFLLPGQSQPLLCSLDWGTLGRMALSSALSVACAPGLVAFLGGLWRGRARTVRRGRGWTELAP